MNIKAVAEYFIIALPYMMFAVFCLGVFFRIMIWYTVRRHDWFAREFERRVSRYMDKEIPGVVKDVSFYVLAKKMLERTFYEAFALRDRLQRRKGDPAMRLADRVFLVKQGCAWYVKDILNQLKFLKWTNETPKLINITKATFSQNPCFNRVFGILPIGGLNDLISILPGLFVVAGILGTFIGIAGGLQHLGGMNLQDMDNTRHIMDTFLGEIAFAMMTSITGIILSLCSHVINTIFSPERVFVSVVDRFESALDLLWYRSDNNNYPRNEAPFDEHRDPVEALAEEAVKAEVSKLVQKREPVTPQPAKAS